MKTLHFPNDCPSPVDFHGRKHDSDTVGDRVLSAWSVAAGICWVQTRSPGVARKLEQRADSRLVLRGVAGGFLRTFEFHHGLAWAWRLVARYTKDAEPTNTAFLSPAAPARPRKKKNGINGQLTLNTPTTVTAQTAPTTP